MTTATRSVAPLFAPAFAAPTPISSRRRDPGRLTALVGTWRGTGRRTSADGTPVDTVESLVAQSLDTARPALPGLALCGVAAVHTAVDGASEPAVWMTQPARRWSATGPQPVTRLTTAPGGGSLLAQGTATVFDGVPVLHNPGARTGEYAHSLFPAFGAAPVRVPPLVASTVLAAASTEDPVESLRDVVRAQVADRCTFSGVVLNVCTRMRLDFAGRDDGPTVTVTPPNAGGGADAAIAYATYWLETVRPARGAAFEQLQYAQVVVPDHPVAVAPVTPLVAVGTLRRLD
jgi:hypothetical protein